MNTDHLITAAAAIEIAESIVRERRLLGMREFDTGLRYGGPHTYVEFKRAFSVDCTLSIDFDSGERKPICRRGSREVVDHVWVQRPRIEISWSSTGRSVSNAFAAATLYREVAELAALIDARLADESIGWLESTQKPADACGKE